MRKELGKWILDVTKYIATVGIIAPFLAKSDQWYWFLILIVIDALLVILGLFLSNEGSTKKSRRK